MCNRARIHLVTWLFILIAFAVLSSVQCQYCTSGPCQNDAVCEDTPTGYECFCVDGYAGQNCEINFDDCASTPCKNGATCIDGVADFVCACANGFTGVICEEDIDECISQPCTQNGTCINFVNGYVCQCPEPFKGDNCDQFPCETVPCENGAICRDDVAFNESTSGYVCQCIFGFTGERCETNIEDCNDENVTYCNGNGLCVDGIGDYSCLCEPGWIGDYCEFPDNDCIGNDCRNNASCIDQQLGYICVCPDGYEGSLCEREKDECSAYKPCQNGASCIDLFNGYRCACSQGWIGDNCTEQVNECRSSPCKNGATCLDMIGGFVCSCAPFFTGQLCEQPYNPCAPGYNPCQNGANCVVPPDGQYRCFCKDGYTGVHCEVNVNECLSSPCENNSTCEDFISGYVCHCMLGWTGKDCEQNIDDCLSNSCQNDAECVDLLNGFECNCTGDYTGRLCNEMYDFCESDPCLNGATCISVLGDYECLCSSPYTGKQCKALIDGCSSSPCQNNGVCMNTLNGVVCNCPHPYTGATCDERINYCASEPCLNGGTCNRLIDGFICVCPQFLTGKQCTDLIDYCGDEPCKNGAYCINDLSRYRCSCLYGFKGENCTDMIDFCIESPCQNNANCSNIPGGFNCQCPQEFTGELCESIVVIPIIPSPSSFYQAYSSFTTTKIIDSISTGHGNVLTSFELSLSPLYMASYSTSETRSNVLNLQPSSYSDFSNIDLTISSHIDSITVSFSTSEPRTLSVIQSTPVPEEYSSKKTSHIESAIMTSSTLTSLSSLEFYTTYTKPTFPFSSLPTSSDVEKSKSDITTSFVSIVASSLSYGSVDPGYTSEQTISRSDTLTTITDKTLFTNHNSFNANVSTSEHSSPDLKLSLMPLTSGSLIPSTTMKIVESVATLNLSSSDKVNISSKREPLISQTFYSSSSNVLNLQPSSYSEFSNKVISSNIHSDTDIKDKQTHLHTNIETSFLTSTYSLPDLDNSFELSSSKHMSTNTHVNYSTSTLYSTLYQNSMFYSISNIDYSLSTATGLSIATVFTKSSIIVTNSKPHFLTTASISGASKMTYLMSSSSSIYPVRSGSAVEYFSTSNISTKKVTDISRDLQATSTYNKPRDISSIHSSDIVSPSALFSETSTNIGIRSHPIDRNLTGIITMSTLDWLNTNVSIGVIEPSSLFYTDVTLPNASIPRTTLMSSYMISDGSSGSYSDVTLSNPHVPRTIIKSSFIMSDNVLVSLGANSSSSSVPESNINGISSIIANTSMSDKTILSTTTHSKSSDGRLSSTPPTSAFHIFTLSIDQSTSNLEHQEPQTSVSVIRSDMISDLISKQTVSASTSEYSYVSNRSIRPTHTMQKTTTFKYGTTFDSVSVEGTTRQETISQTKVTTSPPELQTSYTSYKKFKFSSSLVLKSLSPSLTFSLYHTQSSDQNSITSSTESPNTPELSTKHTFFTDAIRPFTDIESFGSTLLRYSIFTSLSSFIAPSLTIESQTGSLISHTSFLTSPTSSLLSETSSQTLTTASVTPTTASVIPTTQIPTTPCGFLDCNNNGICHEDRLGTFCVCDAKYAGINCEIETRDCQGITCENGGYCTVVVGAYESRVPRCNCPMPYSGSFCTKEILLHFPSFIGSSFLEFPPPSFTSEKSNEIFVSVKTTQLKGTILYAANEDSGDIYSSYIRLHLIGGRPVYEFSCDGIVSGTVKTDKEINTGHIYELTIRQAWSDSLGRWCSASLDVNGRVFVSRALLAVGKPAPLGNLYLGGFPRHGRNSGSGASIYILDGFIGCIRNLQINQQGIDLVSMATRSANIENCNVPVCQHSPCKNGGTCHSVADDWYCSCLYGYGGTFCERKLCDIDPCLHGGTCIILEEEQDQLCLCPFGRGGVICETALTITTPHYSGIKFGLTSFTAYARPLYVAESFEAEFSMIVDSDATDSNLILYIGDTGMHAEDGDFMAVGIYRGYLVFRFDLGSGHGEIYSPEPLNQSITNHQVRLGRTGNKGWLQVDNQRNVSGQSRGPLTALNTNSMLYVGGYPNNVTAMIPKYARFDDGFRGCIYQLRIRTSESVFESPGSPPGHVEEGRNIRQCSDVSCNTDLCHNGAECVDIGASIFCNCSEGWRGTTCLDQTTVCDVSNACVEGSRCAPTVPSGYKCICPVGKHGAFCEEEITISDPEFMFEDSYMAFEPVHIRQSVSIILQIKPRNLNGLMFYTAQRLHSNAGDFLSITLHDGKVRLRYDVGSGVNVVETPNTLNIDQWHTVEVSRNSTHGGIRVDDHMTVSMATGKMAYLDTTSDFYLGGLPHLNDMSPKATVLESGTFMGCVRELTVNSKNYVLTEQGAKHGQNIGDCDGTACGYHVCQNGGLCTSGTDTDYICTCTEEFYGTHCDIPIQCQGHSCYHGSCRVIDSESYECDCYIGWTGPSCDKEDNIGTSIHLGSYSYIILTDKQYETRNKNRTVLSFSFKTRTRNSLLLWHGQTYTEDEDYLGIGLQDGHVKLVWNLGWYSNDEVITTSRYNDNSWYAVTLEIERQDLKITIDEFIYTSSVSGDFYDLDTGGIYHLGNFKDKSVKTATFGYYTETFEGCIKYFRFHGSDDVIFDLADEGINVLTCS